MSAHQDQLATATTGLAGYRIRRLRLIMTQLQQLGRLDDLDEAIAERQRTLTLRSWALLRAAAALSTVVDEGQQTSGTLLSTS